jgi:hypothetical protein
MKKNYRYLFSLLLLGSVHELSAQVTFGLNPGLGTFVSEAPIEIDTQSRYGFLAVNYARPIEDSRFRLFFSYQIGLLNSATSANTIAEILIDPYFHNYSSLLINVTPGLGYALVNQEKFQVISHVGYNLQLNSVYEYGRFDDIPFKSERDIYNVGLHAGLSLYIHLGKRFILHVVPIRYQRNRAFESLTFGLHFG